MFSRGLWNPSWFKRLVSHKHCRSWGLGNPRLHKLRQLIISRGLCNPRLVMLSCTSNTHTTWLCSVSPENISNSLIYHIVTVCFPSSISAYKLVHNTIENHWASWIYIGMLLTMDSTLIYLSAQYYLDSIMQTLPGHFLWFKWCIEHYREN